MNPLIPIDSLQPHPAPPSLTRISDPSIDAFEAFIDHMVAEKLSHQGTPPAAIAAQQSLETFRHKLAVLTGMLEQAQIAMNSSSQPEGGPANLDKEKYFLLKSKLSQVGLPDGTNNLI